MSLGQMAISQPSDELQINVFTLKADVNHFHPNISLLILLFYFYFWIFYFRVFIGSFFSSLVFENAIHIIFQF